MIRHCAKWVDAEVWVLIQIREFNHCWVEISEILIKYLIQTSIDAGSSEVDTLYDCLLFETIEVCLWVKVFLQMKKKCLSWKKGGIGVYRQFHQFSAVCWLTDLIWKRDKGVLSVELTKWRNPRPLVVVLKGEEEFEDTKEAIRIRISKKNRQHNGQKKKHKRTNNDLQNMHIKLKIE